MQIGMIGLGRMGSNMVLRLLSDRHECVVYDEDPASRERLAAAGAVAVDSLAALVAALKRPRPIWMMIPDKVVDSVMAKLAGLLDRDDILIDGGNTYFPDDVRRARQLAEQGIAYVDVGTSGGVWGRERGYCLMIGGQADTVQLLDPIFRTLSPAHNSVAATPGGPLPGSTADQETRQREPERPQPKPPAALPPGERKGSAFPETHPKIPEAPPPPRCEVWRSGQSY